MGPGSFSGLPFKQCPTGCCYSTSTSRLVKRTRFCSFGGHGRCNGGRGSQTRTYSPQKMLCLVRVSDINQKFVDGHSKLVESGNAIRLEPLQDNPSPSIGPQKFQCRSYPFDTVGKADAELGPWDGVLLLPQFQQWGSVEWLVWKRRPLQVGFQCWRGHRGYWIERFLF